MLAAGARGFLLKSDAGRDLVAAVEAVQHRRTFFTPKVAQMLLDGYLRPQESDTLDRGVLTPREREVIQLVAEGKSYQGSCLSSQPQREDGRDSPHKSYAQARPAFGRGSYALCRAKRDRPGLLRRMMNFALRCCLEPSHVKRHRTLITASTVYRPAKRPA